MSRFINYLHIVDHEDPRWMQRDDYLKRSLPMAITLPSMSKYVIRPKVARLIRLKSTEETIQEGIITRMPVIGERFFVGNEGWSTSAVTEIKSEVENIYIIKTLYAEYRLEITN